MGSLPDRWMKDYHGLQCQRSAGYARLSAHSCVKSPAEEVPARQGGRSALRRARQSVVESNFTGSLAATARQRPRRIFGAAGGADSYRRCVHGEILHVIITHCYYPIVLTYCYYHIYSSFVVSVKIIYLLLLLFFKLVYLYSLYFYIYYCLLLFLLLLIVIMINIFLLTIYYHCDVIK